MTRLLLTSPALQPGAGNVFFNIATDRLSRGQDIFTMVSHNHFDALHFIAANLECETTVLEFPRIEDIEAEVAKGYDYVGINFTLLNLQQTFHTCARIKAVSPDTQVILGGYGTSCFNTLFKDMPAMRNNIDHICMGEGVRFMRALLGEDINAPYHQAVGPLAGSAMSWMAPFAYGSNGFVVSGLGCPNMCEFCSTAHYYHGEFIELFKASGIHRGIQEICTANPRLRNAAIFDENLFKDKAKVLELGRLLRDDPALGLDRIAFFGFGTVEDLSRYDIEELVLAGVGSIWIGVESMYSNLPKRQGKSVEAVFGDLHAHGITTIGSWIGGWDYHTPENIDDDLDQFIHLRPTQSQLLPLTPVPGTRLWERMVGEDMAKAMRYFGRSDGSDAAGAFTRDELLNIIERGHRRLYEYAGPSVMRALRVALNGYEYCAASNNPDLNTKKAAYHRDTIRGLYHFLKPAEFYAPNDHVRKEVRELRARYHDVLGEPGVEERVMERYAFYKATQAKINQAFGAAIVRQEPFRYYTYRQGGATREGVPYTVTYPHVDWHFEHETTRSNAEYAFVQKLIEYAAQGASPDDIDARIADTFGDLDRFGDIAHTLAAAPWANQSGVDSGMLVMQKGRTAASAGKPPEGVRDFLRLTVTS